MKPEISLSVENGVPVPIPRKNWEPFAILNRLEIDQSVVVPGVDIWQAGQAARWRKRRYRKHFTCRTVEGGVRIWRLS